MDLLLGIIMNGYDQPYPQTEVKLKKRKKDSLFFLCGLSFELVDCIVLVQAMFFQLWPQLCAMYYTIIGTRRILYLYIKYLLYSYNNMPILGGHVT